MHFKDAEIKDIEAVVDYCKMIWTDNSYEKDGIRETFERIIKSDDCFSFFILDDDDNYHGFCHGVIIDTFWMSGRTCYVSSIVTNTEDRGKGYGKQLMDNAKRIAQEHGCKAMILDSAFHRTNAHKFYEKYGYERNCYGFDMML